MEINSRPTKFNIGSTEPPTVNLGQQLITDTIEEIGKSEWKANAVLKIVNRENLSISVVLVVKLRLSIFLDYSSLRILSKL